MARVKAGNASWQKVEKKNRGSLGRNYMVQIVRGKSGLHSSDDSPSRSGQRSDGESLV